MKRVKYHYNTHSLRYERAVDPLWKKILRVVGFISAALVTSFIIVLIAYKFFASPREIHISGELKEMRAKYETLSNKLILVQGQLAELQKRDHQIYRTIFEANPGPDSVSQSQLVIKQEYDQLAVMSNRELIANAHSTLTEISRQIELENKSYDEINKLIKNKQKMLAHIPAIQPISNKDLTLIASGFGYRIDPIYKTIKFHPGIDFAASKGTEIYATGDGTVVYAGKNGDGYGKHVIINNGYGYKTLFGHMEKIKVKSGEKVKRGQVIGWVGNTGKSTGPHCHYEVIKDGQQIDPVYFFYNDLTPEQYQRMLKIASSSNQSLD